jgi:hypothetical protein
VNFFLLFYQVAFVGSGTDRIDYIELRFTLETLAVILPV